MPLVQSAVTTEVLDAAAHAALVASPRAGAMTSFVGVIRDRWGHGWGYAAALGLLFANFGTICAEYAGI